MEKRHLEDREDPPLPKNIWRNNYWGKSRVLPKVIWVYLFVGYLGNLMPLPFKTYYYYPTFDWNPAQQSYDTS